LLRLTVGAVLEVEVVVVPPAVVVLADDVEMVDPPNCPVLRVPVVWPILGAM
jgi:hypothetical protein